MQRRQISFPSREDSHEAFSQESFAQSGAAAIASTRAAAISCGATMAVPVTRILTLHPNNLSDFVLSLPALHALRESFPGARFCGAMRPALAGLLHNSPLVDDVLPRAPGGLSQQTALMLQLHAQHFDIAVALSPSRSTTLLAWSSAAATRVGFSCAKMDALLTHRVESAPPFDTEAYLELSRAVGCAAHQHDLRGLLSLSPQTQISAARVLEKHGIRGDFLVAAPGGASSPRGDNTSGAPLSAASTRARRRRGMLAARRAAQNVETSSREYSQPSDNARERDETNRATNDATRHAADNAKRDEERDYEETRATVASREYSQEHFATKEGAQNAEKPLAAFHDNAQRDNAQRGATPRDEAQFESTPRDDAPPDALFEARRAAETAWRGAMESFAPSAARELKEWPAAHWARSLDELSSRAPIVLIGNAPSPITPLMRNRVLDLGGFLDLPTMAALCAGARLFLGTDSGLMHLAAAQETPVLALFGPTDWKKRSPRGASTRVLHFDIECAPCNRRDCLWHGQDERACMTRLSPEEIVRAARELVGL